MSTVGKLETRGEINIHWSIPSFFSLSRDKFYYSNHINFSGFRWYLKIYPSCHSGEKTNEWIAVNLVRWTKGQPVRLTYSLGLGNKSDETYTQFSTFVFDNNNWERGPHKLLTRPELEENRSVYAPDDVLTVTCFMKTSPPNVVSRIEKLSEDLKELMVRKFDSDITARVGGEEFRLHQSVLSARIAVFNAMFKHGTSEAETGVVTINDVDPATFRTFLQYVYTGTVENLSTKNALNLYEVADKYLVLELKEDCLEFLKRTLSVDSFIDTLSLALRHDEGELVEYAQKFSTDHMKMIIENEKWKNFAKDFPADANDLLTKAVVHYAKK